MASGHANRANRPHTWPHRPAMQREASSCQPGAVHTCQPGTFDTWHVCDLPRQATNGCFLAPPWPRWPTGQPVRLLGQCGLLDVLHVSAVQLFRRHTSKLSSACEGHPSDSRHQAPHRDGVEHSAGRQPLLAAGGPPECDAVQLVSGRNRQLPDHPYLGRALVVD